MTICRWCQRERSLACQNTRDMTDFAIAGDLECLRQIALASGGESGLRYVVLNYVERAATSRPSAPSRVDAEEAARKSYLEIYGSLGAGFPMFKRGYLAAMPSAPSWSCGARGSTGANDPQECNWPMCGCDPYADKVIAALQEHGCIIAPGAVRPSAPSEAEVERVARAIDDNGVMDVPDGTPGPHVAWPEAEKEALRRKARAALAETGGAKEGKE